MVFLRLKDSDFRMYVVCIKPAFFMLKSCIGRDSHVKASATATVGEIDPSASGESAARVGDTIQVSWSAVTDDDSQFRVVAQVAPASLGGASVWVVLSGSERHLIRAGGEVR